MIWSTTSSMLMYGFWKKFMESYSQAIYGVKAVDNVKEKE